MSADSAFSSFDKICPSQDLQPVAAHDDPRVAAPSAPSVPFIIFGSQGSDFLSAFDPILTLSQRHPLLASFLSLALEAVRNELQSIANRFPDGSPSTPTNHPAEIELLPLLPPFEPFADLRSLTSFHRRTGLTDPVVNGVLLSLLQTAHVVALLCIAHRRGQDGETPCETDDHISQAWKAVVSPSSHLLGFCTGALSAYSLRHLIEDGPAPLPKVAWAYCQDAIKTIRACFWISVRSTLARHRLLSPASDPSHSEPWSIVVAFKEPSTVTKLWTHLQRFNELEQARPLDRVVPLVVTARAANQVSIGGPPLALERFRSILTEDLGQACRVSRLEIFSPYHSPALEEEASLVLLDLGRRGMLEDVGLPSSSKNIWQTVTGQVLPEISTVGVFQMLIQSNLSRTADWDAMVENLVTSEQGVPITAQSRPDVIISFGPGNHLAADLRSRLRDRFASRDFSIIDVPMLLRERCSRQAQPVLSHALPAQLRADAYADEVVIVSMACRFPGNVRSPEQLWTCLETGRSTVAEIPKHLFDIDAYFGAGKNQTMARHMHALPEEVVRSMDARLFSMSPKEVEQLDPQHRLVMLCSYEALERAGFSSEANSPSSFDKKRIAVCMGASWDDYRENASWNIGSYFITGNIRAFIPGHVSFSLSFEGPSVSVDSLECSAVSAIQWSRRALLSGQCDVALTGAVSVLTQPQMFIAMDKEGILSRTGTNLTFSSRHDGTTRGDGCGVLLMKRRSTAIQDGDQILATVSAARTAYHGARPDGEGAVAAQSSFLADVLSEAGLDASALAHIEASGFHTQLGEAAEVEAFAQLLTRSKGARVNSSNDVVSVASSRPNLGAGEAVSAMASVIKAVLILNQGIVPRQVSIPSPSELQPRIAAICASSSLFVPTEAQLLPERTDDKGRRTILVNSLASTGCHGAVLLQKSGSDGVEAAAASRPMGTGTNGDSGAWIFLLSAKTSESADKLKKAIVDYLQREVCLADLSYTLACRRTHHPLRLAVVASEQEELIRKLRAAAFTEARPTSDLRPLAMLFETVDDASIEDLRKSFQLYGDLQERFDTLGSTLDARGAAEKHRVAEAMQMCLASLLDEYGLRPSLVAGKVLPSLYSGGWLDVDGVAALLSDLARHGARPSLGSLIRSGYASVLGADGKTIQPNDVLHSASDRLWRQLVDQVNGHHIGTNEALPDDHQWVRVGELVSLVHKDDLVTNEVRQCDSGGGRLVSSLFTTLGRLYRHGYTIRWIEVFRPHLAELRFIPTLPAYPFHLQSFWMEYHDRNLLKSTVTASQAPLDSSFGNCAARGPDESDIAEIPTQPLLTAQVSADEELRIYRSDLADPLQSFLQKAASPAALGVECMAETVWEATSQAHERSCVRLTHIRLPQAGQELLGANDVVLAVNIDPRTPESSAGSVQLRTDASASVIIGELNYRWIDDQDLDRRWLKLQGYISERLSRLRDGGEKLDAKLIYKSLGGDDSTFTRSIRNGHFSDDSREAMFCISDALGSTAPDADLLRGIPMLLTSAGECLRWYSCNVDGGADAGLAITSMDEMVVRNEVLQGLRLPPTKPQEYIAFVSPSARAAPEDSSNEGLVVDLLLLDAQMCIFGELDGIRLESVEAAPGRRVQEKAPAAAASLEAAQLPGKSVQRERPAGPEAAQQLLPRTSSRVAQEIHAKIIGVLASELGIAADEMKPQAKFVDLGLDSLMSLVCISSLESLNLGFSLPQSLFMECSSPQELLAWIKEQVGDQGDEVDPGPVLQPQSDVGSAAAVVASANSSTAFREVPTESEAAISSKPAGGNSMAEETMKTITSTIEKELGVAEGSIDEGANLADLGMDSLMSLLVLGNLSSSLPIQLPSSLFMEYTSLREIRHFLDNEFGPPEAAGQVATGSQQADSGVEQVVIPELHAPVLLRKGTEREGSTPLFLLPDGSGMSTVYQFLPAMDRDVYSVNSPFLRDASLWTGGIGQIAQYYLQSMKLLQPEGPWLVAGWSFGGMVAFEIARLLASSGGKESDRVAALLLLDSPCPLLYPPLPFSVVDWIFTAPEVRDIAPPALSPKLLAHFRATVQSLVGYRPADAFAGTHKAKIPQTWYIVADKQLPGSVQDINGANESVSWLFRPNRATSGTDGWDRCIPLDNITVVPITEANHFTLVRQPIIAAVAHIIAQACRTALNSPRS